MTVTERRHSSTYFHWTCERCGHTDVFASMVLLRSAETQHNSPRRTWARGGTNRSPCEAMRMDRRQS